LVENLDIDQENYI
jgi:hypothetical protein